MIKNFLSSDSLERKTWFLVILSYNTIRQFRKDNYPLIGAIIAAFLALAGAAWSLDLPYFLAFNLFCSVYWSFIYLSIYIDIFWKVYERTKDMVKRAFTQKRKAILLFLQISFLIASFFIFISFYQLLFPEIEKDHLVNPLQVTAQFSSFLFHFRYPFKPVRVRYLLLLCFFLSLKKRTKFQFLISFFIYLTLSILIGVISSPSGKPTILGIPYGIFIFVFIHLWLFLGCFFFKESLPGESQPLVPIFFSGLFFLLCYFPELAWLEKWIEGIDLLLLFFGLFSLLESGEIISERRTNDNPFLRRRPFKKNKKKTQKKRVTKTISRGDIPK